MEKIKKVIIKYKSGEIFFMFRLFNFIIAGKEIEVNCKLFSAGLAWVFLSICVG